MSLALSAESLMSSAKSMTVISCLLMGLAGRDRMLGTRGEPDDRCCSGEGDRRGDEHGTGRQRIGLPVDDITEELTRLVRGEAVRLQRLHGRLRAVQKPRQFAAFALSAVVPHGRDDRGS